MGYRLTKEQHGAASEGDIDVIAQSVFIQSHNPINVDKALRFKYNSTCRCFLPLFSLGLFLRAGRYAVLFFNALLY